MKSERHQWNELEAPCLPCNCSSQLANKRASNVDTHK